MIQLPECERKTDGNNRGERERENDLAACAHWDTGTLQNRNIVHQNALGAMSKFRAAQNAHEA